MAPKSYQTSSDASGGIIFYTHMTELCTRGEPHLHITSLRIPQLQVRLPVADDAEALLRIFTDARNIQYDKSCAGLDNSEAIANLIRQWRDIGHPLSRANVVVIVDDKTVGTGGLGWIGKRRSDGKMIGDAGIMLDSDFRGRGYACEALSMIVDHGFRFLGTDEVHISCVDANTAFKEFMNSKFGFKAKRIEDKMFGNEWIWTVRRDMWEQSCHAAKPREQTTKADKTRSSDG